MWEVLYTCYFSLFIFNAVTLVLAHFPLSESNWTNALASSQHTTVKRLLLEFKTKKKSGLNVFLISIAPVVVTAFALTIQ